MPQIPNFPAPEAPGNSAQSYLADTSGIKQVGQARAELGQAVEGIGALAHQVNQIHQEAAKTQAATSLSAAGSDALDSLNDPTNPQNGDPSTYVPRVQQQLDKATAEQEKQGAIKNLSPAMRLEWETQKQKLNTEVVTKAKYAAMSKQVDVAKGVFEVQQGNQIRNGDEPGALATNDYMVSHGLISAVDGAKNKLQIPQQIDYGQAVKLMAMNSLTTSGGPRVAEEALTEQDSSGNFTNYKRLSPEQRDGLLRVARVYGFNEAAGFKTALNSTLAGGYPQDPVDLAKFTEQVKLGEAKGILSKAEAKSYLTPPKGTYDIQKTAALGTEIKTYNPDLDKDGMEHAKLAAMIADPNIPPAAREEYAKKLGEQWSGKQGATQKQITSEAKNAFVKGQFVPIPDEVDTPHMFGLWKSHEVLPAYGTDWQKTAPAEYKQAATSQFNKYLTDMDTYFKAHASDNQGEGPTPLEADRYSQELMKPVHMSAVSASLQKSFSAPSAAPTVPDGAVAYLKAHPEMKDQFDAKYGKGAAAAALK